MERKVDGGKLIMGILLIAIPVAILALWWYFHAQPPTMLPKAGGGPRAFGLVIDHPPKDFFDRTAQTLVGIGVCLASIGWGAAKVIRAIKFGREVVE